MTRPCPLTLDSLHVLCFRYRSVLLGSICLDIFLRSLEAQKLSRFRRTRSSGPCIILCPHAEPTWAPAVKGPLPGEPPSGLSPLEGWCAAHSPSLTRPRPRRPSPPSRGCPPDCSSRSHVAVLLPILLPFSRRQVLTGLLILALLFVFRLRRARAPSPELPRSSHTSESASHPVPSVLVRGQTLGHRPRTRAFHRRGRGCSLQTRFRFLFDGRDAPCPISAGERLNGFPRSRTAVCSGASRPRHLSQTPVGLRRGHAGHACSGPCSFCPCVCPSVLSGASSSEHQGSSPTPTRTVWLLSNSVFSFFFFF